MHLELLNFDFFLVLICPFCISKYSSCIVLSAPILEATFLIHYLFINLFILTALKYIYKSLFCVYQSFAFMYVCNTCILGAHRG